jgi:hypothetical protein
MFDTLLKPYRRAEEDGFTIDAIRGALWESFDPHRCFAVGVFFWWGKRQIFRMTHKKFDWTDSGVFRQRKVPVKERWGPPPPRRYDDDGNLINHI